MAHLRPWLRPGRHAPAGRGHRQRDEQLVDAVADGDDRAHRVAHPAGVQPDVPLGSRLSRVAGLDVPARQPVRRPGSPLVLAALGVFIIFKARRASMATSAAAIGWALIVVLVTTALFRWPTEAGEAADSTVTGTLGAVVERTRRQRARRGAAVPRSPRTSHESIFYRAWLAGTLGSPDSATARKYGPELFRAQALTWREAALLRARPRRWPRVIEKKKEAWKETADKIQDEDPEAYEYLTGRRSETRIGYAVLSATAAPPRPPVPAHLRAAARGVLPDRASRRDAVPRVRRPGRLPGLTRPGHRRSRARWGGAGQRDHLRDRRHRHRPGPGDPVRPGWQRARLAQPGADATVRVRHVGGAAIRSVA